MANAWHTKRQAIATRLYLKHVQKFGDSITYVPAGYTSGCSIYALVPNSARSLFGPDEERIDVDVPVQTGITTTTASGAIIQIDSVKWAIESVEVLDSQYPVGYKLTCFRWMHDSPEIQY